MSRFLSLCVAVLALLGSSAMAQTYTIRWMGVPTTASGQGVAYTGKGFTITALTTPQSGSLPTGSILYLCRSDYYGGSMALPIDPHITDNGGLYTDNYAAATPSPYTTPTTITYTATYKVNGVVKQTGQFVVNITAAPTIPSGLSAATTSTSFTLAWGTSSTVPGEVVGYEVMMNGISQGVSSTNPTALQRTFTGLPPNTPYTMSVRAQDAFLAWTNWSTNYTVTTGPLAPGTPSASGVAATTATLNWPSPPGAATYNIQWSVNNGAYNLMTLGISGTSYALTGLAQGTPYGFKVQAVNASGGTSDWSSPVSFTTSVIIVDKTPPTVPAGFSIPSWDASSITIAWTPSTDDVDNPVTLYNVQVTPLNGSANVYPASTPSYKITGASAGAVYTVQVKAGDHAGHWSNNSAPFTVTVPATGGGAPSLNGGGAVVPPPTPSGVTLVGTMGGDVVVDNKGSANVSIPLQITPGRSGGITPKVSLNYNSASGNGTLGVGWSLSTGFPEAITRGRSIQARDGIVKGVTFGTDDKIYLDGKRLICTSGVYGAPNSTYRTEVDSFVTITTTGTGSNIETFTLTDKSGVQYVFGKYSGTTDAYQTGGELTHTPSGLAYAYALKHVQDTIGNYCDLTYNNFIDIENDGVMGYNEAVLSNVIYGGNSAAGACARVDFLYNVTAVTGSTPVRLDANVSLIAGHGFRKTQRLDRVTARNGADPAATIVADYELGYQYAPLNGRTRLTTVSPFLLRPGTTSLDAVPLTKITWSDDTQQVDPVVLRTGIVAGGTSLPTASPDSRYTWFYFGDFNGDGKEDYLDTTGGVFTVYLNNGTGYAAGTVWGNTGIGTAYKGAAWLADINGDGKKDIIFADDQCQHLYAAISTGSGFATPVLICTIGEPFNDPNVDPNITSTTLRSSEAEALCSRVVIGDFNGDGRDDILIHGFNGYFYTLCATGNPLQPFSGLSKSASRGSTCQVVPTWDWSLSLTGFRVPVNYSIRPMPCDLDGDGRCDYVWVETTRSGSPSDYQYTVIRTINYIISKPSSDPANPIVFSAPSPCDAQIASRGGNPATDPFAYEDVYYPILTGDFNGDGMTDFLVLSNHLVNNHRWMLWLSRGSDSTGFKGFDLIPGPIPDQITANNAPFPSYFVAADSGTWVGQLAKPISLPNFAELYSAIECSPGMNMFAVDLNNDGLADYVWYHDGLAGDPNIGWWAMYSTGTGFANPTKLSGFPWSDMTAGWSKVGANPFARQSLTSSTADINGDGRNDWAISAGGNGFNNGLTGFYFKRGLLGDLVTKIERGMGLDPVTKTPTPLSITTTTQVAYKAAKDDSIYTASAASLSYPIREMRPSTPVVSDIYKDSGGATPAQYSYQYSGNTLDLSGRGALGFHSFVTLDRQTGVFKYQFLTQSFPMTGLTAREQTYRNWSGTNFRLISTHNNTVVFDEVTNGSTPYGTVYPFISQAIESRWEDSTVAHFTHTATGPDSQPEYLFPLTPAEAPYITITAQSLFDKQLAVQTTTPGLGYQPSDRNSSGNDVVIGTPNYSSFAAMAFPQQITYGNLTQLYTDYGDGYTEKVNTTYLAPTSNGLTGLVNTVVTSVTSPNYTDSAPTKTYTYSGQTPLVATDATSTSNSNLNVTLTYTRDNRGRVIKINRSGYTAANDPQSIGSVDTYQATAFDDRFDLPTTELNAYNHTTTTAYDQVLGKPNSVTDLNGHTITTTYDPLGRATNVHDSLLGLDTNTSFSLDSSQPVTGPGGIAIASAYAVQTSQTVKPTVTAYYDRLGRVIRTIKSGFNGNLTYADTGYNILGQTVAASLPYGSTTQPNQIPWTTTTYDAMGRVSTVTAPNNTKTTNTYIGRTTQVTVTTTDSPAKSQTNTTYVNAKGATIKVWNADNVPSGIDPKNGSATPPSIAFDLDGLGRMRKTTLLGQTQAITATYDALGHQVSLNDPDKGNWTYLNNALGLVVSQTDGKATTTTTTFDVLNRPLTRITAETAGGPVETANWYYFDPTADVATHRIAKGNQGWYGALQRTDSVTTGAPGYAAPQTVSAHYYDAKGRPIIDLNTIDAKWFYTYTDYDAYSRVSQVRRFWRVPGHEAPTDQPYLWNDYGYTYTYDGKSYLLSLQDSLGQTWWKADGTYGYDYLDRPVKVQKGNALWTQRTYNPNDGTLTNILTGPTAGSGAVQNLAFAYDGLGNLASRINYVRNTTETCGYDSLNRLTSTSVGAQTVSTAFLANGNISTKTGIDGSTSAAYTYDATRPHAVSTAFGYSMSYDGNGNLLTRSGNSHTWTTRWTGFDKPRWLAQDTNGSEFSYNADRSRVIHLDFDSTSGGAPLHYNLKRIYAMGSTMEIDYKNTVTSGAGTNWLLNAVRIYVPGPDGIEGTMEFDPQAPFDKAQRTLVYHYDHLGSIDCITPYGSTSTIYALDESGRSAYYSYNAWGQRRNADTWLGIPGNTAQGGPTDVTPRGFTGHEMLDNIGLVHMNGRIYDPLLGRFLSADVEVQFSGSLQSYNRYSYVRNNPLTAFDPTGWWEIKLGFGMSLTNEGDNLGARAFRAVKSAVMSGSVENAKGNLLNIKETLEKDEKEGGPMYVMIKDLGVGPIPEGPMMGPLIGGGGEALLAGDRIEALANAISGTAAVANMAKSDVKSKDGDTVSQKPPAERERVYDKPEPGQPTKHGNQTSSGSKGDISPAPTDGQAALDNSVSVKVKPNGETRVGVDQANKEVVVLDRQQQTATQDVFHGHVPEILKPDVKNVVKENFPNVRVNKNGTWRFYDPPPTE